MHFKSQDTILRKRKHAYYNYKACTTISVVATTSEAKVIFKSVFHSIISPPSAKNFDIEIYRPLWTRKEKHLAVASPVVGICFKQRVVKNINDIVIHE